MQKEYWHCYVMQKLRAVDHLMKECCLSHLIYRVHHFAAGCILVHLSRYWGHLLVAATPSPCLVVFFYSWELERRAKCSWKSKWWQQDMRERCVCYPVLHLTHVLSMHTPVCFGFFFLLVTAFFYQSYPSCFNESVPTSLVTSLRNMR